MDGSTRMQLDGIISHGAEQVNYTTYPTGKRINIDAFQQRGQMLLAISGYPAPNKNDEKTLPDKPRISQNCFFQGISELKLRCRQCPVGLMMLPDKSCKPKIPGDIINPTGTRDMVFDMS